MFDRILVPVDFSPASLTALRCANQLADKCNSEQFVVNVLTFVANKEEASKFLVRGADLLTVFGKELKEFILEEPYSNRSSDVLVREDASAEIVKYSQEHNCDLIVIGSHGHSTVVNILLGSVAQKLLRHSPVPVMVVPRHRNPDAQVKFENILAPIDFSEISLRAVRLACRMAETWKSTLHVLHVIDVEERKEAQKMAIPDSIKPQELDVTPTVQNILKQIEFSGTSNVSCVSGDPSEEIVKYASERNVDFIVMGSHGRKGLDRVLIGSTTASVIRNCTVPIFTLCENLERGAERKNV